MEKPYVIGIDMGGTNTKFGLVDARGNVLNSSSIKTQQYTDINLYCDTLCHEMMKLVDAQGGIDLVRGVGAGAPNGNYYTGNIENAANLPWKGIVPFSEMISERMGVPCRTTNDANAAAMGEMTYGAAKGMKNFIMITLGTGVGSGIVIDGKVVYGHDGFAGELGHTKIIRDSSARLCGCGQRGCIEAYASANGVARTAQEWLQTTDRPSILRQLPIADITSKDVFDAAMQGDELAKEIFQYTGTLLGQKLADFIAFSAPEAIILFGGLTKAGDILKRPIEESMNQNVVRFWKNKVKLLFSTLKDSDAAILGASALVWDVQAHAPMSK
ncbi:MAG: ROK family protein [Paludibacteraceae bacterium]|nr:ROK family protein [Paludibacteraceae bacterium]